MMGSKCIVMHYCVFVSVNIVLYVHLCVCRFVLYGFGLNNGAPQSFWFNMIVNFCATADIILAILCYGYLLSRLLVTCKVANKRSSSLKLNMYNVLYSRIPIH